MISDRTFAFLDSSKFLSTDESKDTLDFCILAKKVRPIENIDSLINLYAPW